MMRVNNYGAGTKLLNYKLSSSYPSMRPLGLSDNWKNGYFSFYNKPFNDGDNLTKSWSTTQNKFVGNSELNNNSDLQPLSWLEKRSIIDIDPLDYEDEKEILEAPGEEDVKNTNLSHAKVEIGSQENVHDFVKFAEMRNSANGKFRPNGNVYDHPYQHSANGHVKPNLSYTQLIFLAIETCHDRAMTVNDIYQWCETNYPYYKFVGPSWKNSLRHNLSINKSFKRMPRDGQGGPGRGAYWIVDDKERATLLESIYRAHQQQQVVGMAAAAAAAASAPLCDRNGTNNASTGATTASSPELSLLLRTVANTANTSGTPLLRLGDHPLSQLLAAASAAADTTSGSNGNTCGSDENSLVNAAVNQDGDNPALSASYNSSVSKLDGYCPSADSPNQNRSENTESEIPKLKNRRKSKHEKVRSIAEIEKLLQQRVKPSNLNVSQETNSSADNNNANSCNDSNISNNNNSGSTLGDGSEGGGCGGGSGGNLTTVNVVVAPHFDHLYARYQHFLPPAIPSDMDKRVYRNPSRKMTLTAAANGNDDFDGEEDEGDADFLRNGYHEDDEENDEEDGGGGNSGYEALGESGVTIKTEKLDPDEMMDQVVVKQEKKQPDNIDYESDSTLPMCGPIQSRGILSGTNVKNSSNNCQNISAANSLAKQSKQSIDAGGTRRRKCIRRKKSNVSLSSANRAANAILNRPKRRRIRTTRIDERAEIAAVKFLARLEKKQALINNLDNLYQYLDYQKQQQQKEEKQQQPFSYSSVSHMYAPTRTTAAEQFL